MSVELKNIKQAAKPVRHEVESTLLSSISVLLNKDIKFWGGQLKDKKKEAFYSELHILLSSGIDIRSALDIYCG